MINNIKIVNPRDIEEKFKYRLGDALICKNTGWDYLDNCVETIGYDYKKQNPIKSQSINISSLKKIINTHIEKYNYKLPSANEVVIHYRLGDRTYVKTKRSKYDTIAPTLESSLKKINNVYNEISGNKITIVTAFHSTINLKKHPIDEKNYDYLISLIDALKDKNLNIISQKKPDADFCYVVKAQKPIITIGNFSKLIGLVNTNHIGL